MAKNRFLYREQYPEYSRSLRKEGGVLFEGSIVDQKQSCFGDNRAATLLILHETLKYFPKFKATERRLLIKIGVNR